MPIYAEFGFDADQLAARETSRWRRPAVDAPIKPTADNTVLGTCDAAARTRVSHRVRHKWHNLPALLHLKSASIMLPSSITLD
jgi:hypothetical protein